MTQVPPKATILVISSEQDVLTACKRVLDSKYALLFAKNGAEGQRQLDEHLTQIQLVILDSALADTLAQDWIASMSKSHVLPYIIVLAPQQVPTWMIESMKSGAMDIVRKGESYDCELAIAVRQGFESKQITTYLKRSAQQSKTKTIQDRFSAFLDLYLARRAERSVVSPSEMALFFPSSDAVSELSLEKVIEAVQSKQSYALVKQWKERPTLLVVEDERLLREELITEFENECHVITAASCEAALELCKTTPVIDVAILDIGMPGNMSGDDLAPLLKEKYPDLQILMLTAFVEHRLVVKTVNAGAGDYIVKPYEGKELKHRVFSLLQTSLLNRVLGAYMGVAGE